MRYPAAERLEMIRPVETSPFPGRRTLAQIGISKSTFYAWLDRYVAAGLEAWRIAGRDQGVSGTGSPTRFARRFLVGARSAGADPARGRRHVHGPARPLSPRPAFIASSTPKI